MRWALWAAPARVCRAYCAPAVHFVRVRRAITAAVRRGTLGRWRAQCSAGLRRYVYAQLLPPSAAADALKEKRYLLGCDDHRRRAGARERTRSLRDGGIRYSSSAISFLWALDQPFPQSAALWLGPARLLTAVLDCRCSGACIEPVHLCVGSAHADDAPQQLRELGGVSAELLGDIRRPVAAPPPVVLHQLPVTSGPRALRNAHLSCECACVAGTDATAAPAGKDTWMVLVPVGHLAKHGEPQVGEYSRAPACASMHVRAHVHAQRHMRALACNERSGLCMLTHAGLECDGRTRT